MWVKRIFVFSTVFEISWSLQSWMTWIIKNRKVKESMGFYGGPVVKKLPEVSAEARVWSLCWEGPLQKGMATHSSIFTWEIPWTEEPDRLQSIGLQSQTQPSWASLIAQLVKKCACNTGDPGSIPGLGISTEGIGYSLQYSWASLVAQLVKNPPAMWDTRLQSLGWEGPLEKGKATHSSIPAWRIPWTV